MGFAAGSNTQGANAVAIGAFAGATTQHANSIVINATGGALNSSAAGTLTIAPIRSDAASTPVLVYNATTNEITYNSSTRNIKKNIIDLTANTSHVYDIRPVEYDAISDDRHYVGLIAEEVYEADPYFAWMQNGNPAGIEWFNILLYMVAEMKKLKARLDIVEQR